MSVCIWQNKSGPRFRGPPYPQYASLGAPALLQGKHKIIFKKKQTKIKMKTNLEQWAMAHVYAGKMIEQYTPEQSLDYAENLAQNCHTSEMRILYGMVFLILKMEESLTDNPLFIHDQNEKK